MQTIQLFIGNQRVDLFKDESVTITDTIKNAKDIKNVFTAFTQQFTLPATSVNNRIFKHYYNFDIVQGFDARVRVDASIKLNFNDYKIGKLKLNSVELKKNKAYSYKVVFFGSTVDLNDLVGEDQLSDLLFVEEKTSGSTTSSVADQLKDTSASFTSTVSPGDRVKNQDTSQFATVTSVVNNSTLELDDDIFTSSPEDYTVFLSPIYGNEAVKAKLQLDPTLEKNSLIVPLITHTKRLYYDSAAAIAGDGNLYWNGGGVGTVDHGVEFNDLKFAIRLNEIIKAIENTYTIANGYPQNLIFSDDFFSTSNNTFNNLYMWMNRNLGDVETSTSVDAFTFVAQPFNGGDIIEGVFGDGPNVTVNPFSVSSFQIDIEMNTDLVDYTFVLLKNGVEIFSTARSAGDGDFSVDETDIGVAVNTLQGTFNVQIQSDGQVSFNDINFGVSGTFEAPPNDTITPFSIDVFTGALVTPTIETFDVALQMPEMKVLDFLTGLSKMFNLVFYLNENNEVEVRTLDDGTSDSYYNLPDINTWDITKYIDVTKSQVDVALPFRSVTMSYKDLKTFLALKHGQLFNQPWGAESWNEDTQTKRIDGKDYKIIPPFEHMKFERLVNLDTNNDTTIQVGWSVNESQSAYKGSPLLFYPKHQTGGGITPIQWLVRSAGGGSITGEEIDNYIIPSNSENLTSLTNTRNINFGPMPNEYAREIFVDTLFARFYYNYITNIFRENARLVKFTAFLPLRIILNYNLNDFIIVSGKKYRINSVKTNLLNNKSELELITT
ncbi:MAG: hypothetical protein Unbinned92contig1002_55 [Prokaryotic dsDNA virus sp.]|nr:MAG: hypothetical protein Unbinned92contig1002_55 [Prokaryotic dsDNA virus sp.]|tara:strand:- start:16891 stop:19215 length:2325 start_codon:yes stop_codon:yes gene_type:complete